ncbi:translation machinery-associated protein 20 [Marasmius crinis-equi]|uniref:Translation machinery-associated protein 20 n=1 Tax=Marasmius crinis-equi TaxID=585013 RepID=A0ABR3FXG8_9AGAR
MTKIKNFSFNNVPLYVHDHKYQQPLLRCSKSSFQPSTDIAGQTPVKSSVQRSIRASVLSQWKIEPETLEAIWPKKEGLVHVKCREHLSIYTVKGEPILFQHFDGPFYPTLRMLHKCAHMMCPGLTSKGGHLPPPEEALPPGTPVAIFAEGKEHAVGVGITKMGTEEMRKVNKDIGVETVTYLGDDLWAYAEFSAPVSRKKRKGKQQPRPPLSTLVEQCRKELQENDWYKQCEEIILKSIRFDMKEPPRIVCLGLGSPSSSSISRAQYAFLLNLAESVCLSTPSRLSLYDPVFTDEDGRLFEEHGFSVSPDLRPTGTEPIIYFMPHCDMELYEAVLEANWSEPQIRTLGLIANRLEDYVDNKPARELHTKAPRILSIGKRLRI